mmetsp:Transcript_21067/g.81680  ORF Transcript_21067/g.81680 Transcript_21067/m.81680 type:complete len:563 (+) Transcript_21067:202-1890(+)
MTTSRAASRVRQRMRRSGATQRWMSGASMVGRIVAAAHVGPRSLHLLHPAAGLAQVRDELGLGRAHRRVGDGQLLLQHRVDLGPRTVVEHPVHRRWTLALDRWQPQLGHLAAAADAADQLDGRVAAAGGVAGQDADRRRSDLVQSQPRGAVAPAVDGQRVGRGRGVAAQPVVHLRRAVHQQQQAQPRAVQDALPRAVLLGLAWAQMAAGFEVAQQVGQHQRRTSLHIAAIAQAVPVAAGIAGLVILVGLLEHDGAGRADVGEAGAVVHGLSQREAVDVQPQRGVEQVQALATGQQVVGLVDALATHQRRRVQGQQWQPFGLGGAGVQRGQRLGPGVGMGGRAQRALPGEAAWPVAGPDLFEAEGAVRPREGDGQQALHQVGVEQIAHRRGQMVLAGEVTHQLPGRAGRGVLGLAARVDRGDEAGRRQRAARGAADREHRIGKVDALFLAELLQPRERGAAPVRGPRGTAGHGDQHQRALAIGADGAQPLLHPGVGGLARADGAAGAALGVGHAVVVVQRREQQAHGQGQRRQRHADQRLGQVGQQDAAKDNPAAHRKQHQGR